MADNLNVLEADDDECWAQLEDYRLLLIKNIEPSRITPYLRQCKVLNGEDEEQIFNDPNVFIRRQKVGVLLDILQRTGHKGYVAFLESLELDYPQLYLKITGKEPARAFSILVENVGESGLTQFLMSEVTKLQRLVKEERRRRQALDDAARQQQVRDHELRKQRERVLRMREERDRLWEKARALKEENYGLLHELTRLSEEKNGAFMSNRDLQLEIEKLKHCLMNAESDSKIHRKRTVNLKNAMEQRPSQDMVWSLQRENDLLTSRIQELENSIQKSTALALNEHDRVSIQELEDYKQHAQAKHQELVNNLYALRRNLQEAEQLRDKYLVEKDVLELKCLTLKKDSKMYRARMEEILKQMDEVIRERDKAIATREEYHQENSRNLQDKDKYRKQIRELGEKCDELQVQLFRTEGEVLALQTKLKNCAHQVSDLEDSSLASSLELKSQTSDEDAKDIVVTGTNENEQSLTPEDYNMCKPFKMNDVATDELSTPYRPRARQDNCKFTYRRKRALRSKTNGTNNSPCALTMCHTSGSDNTDTDDI